MGTFRHILAPVDFGDAMQPALDLALSIAKANEAVITRWCTRLISRRSPRRPRARRRAHRVLLGSIAENVVRHSPIPVLTVRPSR